MYNKAPFLQKQIPVKIRIAAAAVLGVIIFALTLIIGGRVANEHDAARYLLRHGFECISNAEVTQITIPAEWNAVYESYNDLQRRNGYNLAAYKGKAVKRFAFAVSPLLSSSSGEATDTAYASLLVYNGKVIGGDVCTYDIDGYMVGLKGKY